MKKPERWIVVDFDCWHGCNNPEFNPGCDESCIRIRINQEMNDEFCLFGKYMKMPCPRCGKMAEQKRSGWWVDVTEDTKLVETYNPSKGTFLPSEVQDYTDQIMVSKVVELTTEIEASKERIKWLRKRIKDIGWRARMKT